MTDLAYSALTELLVNANTPATPLTAGPFTKQGNNTFAVMDLVMDDPINGVSVSAIIDTGGSTWTKFTHRNEGVSGLTIEKWYTNNLAAGALTFSFTLVGLNRNGFYATITEYDGLVTSLSVAATPVTGVAGQVIPPDTNPFSTPSDAIMMHMSVTQTGTDTITGFNGNCGSSTIRTSGAKHLLVADKIPAASLASGLGSIAMNTNLFFHVATFAVFRGTVSPQPPPTPPTNPHFETKGGSGLLADSAPIVSTTYTLVAGRLYIAGIRLGASSTVTKMIDDLGNIWQRVAGQANTNSQLEMWYVISAFSGAATITATLSKNAGNRSIVIAEYSLGINTFVLSSVNGKVTDNATAQFPAIAPISPPTLIVGVVDSGGATDGTWGTPTGVVDNVIEDGSDSGGTVGIVDNGEPTVSSGTGTATYSGTATSTTSIIATFSAVALTPKTIDNGTKVTLTAGVTFVLPTSKGYLNCTIITSAGTIMISDDGQTWQEATLDTNKNLRTSAKFIVSLDADSDMVCYPIPKRKL